MSLVAVNRKEVTMRTSPHISLPKLDLAADMALQDFWRWALINNDDLEAERLCVEWMVGRLLDLPKACVRRVPLSNEFLQISNGVIVELNVRSWNERVAGERWYFAFCTRIEKRAQPWQAWCPEGWDFHLHSMEELVEADVLDPVLLEAFLSRQEPMSAKQFRVVARSRLGLDPSLVSDTSRAPLLLS
jgi:hypothetical protein